MLLSEQVISIRYCLQICSVYTIIIIMKLFLVLAAIIAVVVAGTYEIIEDEAGQQYYAVPITSREKR